jgi:hypothetical protein
MENYPLTLLKANITRKQIPKEILLMSCKYNIRIIWIQRRYIQKWLEKNVQPI